MAFKTLHDIQLHLFPVFLSLTTFQAYAIQRFFSLPQTLSPCFFQLYIRVLHLLFSLEELPYTGLMIQSQLREDFPDPLIQPFHTHSHPSLSQYPVSFFVQHLILLELSVISIFLSLILHYIISSLKIETLCVFLLFCPQYLEQ